MSDVSTHFPALMGIPVVLNPEGSPTLPSTADGMDQALDAGTDIAAVTVGFTDRAVRVETSDVRALELDGLGLQVEFRQPGQLLRLTASVSVLVRNPPPFVLALRPLSGLEEIQRRNWVRVNVKLPIAIDVPAVLRPVPAPSSDGADNAPGGTDGTVERGAGRPWVPVPTLTSDLSAGGARIAMVEGLREGMMTVAYLGLPSGALTVEVEVLDIHGGVARLKFAELGENASTRITRFIFDELLGIRRRAEEREDLG